MITDTLSLSIVICAWVSLCNYSRAEQPRLRSHGASPTSLVLIVSWLRTPVKPPKGLSAGQPCANPARLARSAALGCCVGSPEVLRPHARETTNSVGGRHADSPRFASVANCSRLPKLRERADGDRWALLSFLPMVLRLTLPLGHALWGRRRGGSLLHGEPSLPFASVACACGDLVRCGEVVGRPHPLHRRRPNGRAILRQGRDCGLRGDCLSPRRGHLLARPSFERLTRLPGPRRPGGHVPPGCTGRGAGGSIGIDGPRPPSERPLNAKAKASRP